MAILRTLIIVVAGAYLAVMVYMYVQQRQLQYHPARAGTSPQALGLSGVSEERVKTPDGETIVLWHARPRTGMPTILYFQGNAGELADRAGRMAFFQAKGFGVLFVSYRGFGASTGSVSEQGIMTDARTAYDYLLRQGVAPEQIMLIGESLGTGVAIQLAAERKVAAIALEAPYTATVDVASEIYWWLPVRLLMKDQFLSRDYIGKVKAPLLIQHGDADTIIPVAQGRALFAMANEPKELVIIPGECHDIISEEPVWAREAEFFLKTAGALPLSN